MFIGMIARLFRLFGFGETDEAVRRLEERRRAERELRKLPPHILRDLDWPPKS